MNMKELLYIGNKNCNGLPVKSLLHDYQLNCIYGSYYALEFIKKYSPTLVIYQIPFPDAYALALIEAMQEQVPSKVEIVLICDKENGEFSSLIMERGVRELFYTPLDEHHFRRMIESIISPLQPGQEHPGYEEWDEEEEEDDLSPESLDLHFPEILGSSPGLQEAKRFAYQYASIRLPLIIQGESGTGKELFARAIHALSDRSSHPLKTLNCAALPVTLAESLLFGTERGAFTDSQQKKGLFEMADGGILFLDEVEELSLAIQAKLLRVIEEEKVTRLGSSRERSFNVRLIVATNRKLDQLVKEGVFRKDFYYRLKCLQLDIPPLRMRKEDIPKICEAVLSEGLGNVSKSKEAYTITRDAMRLLQCYSWPGNVRELFHLLQKLMVHTMDRATITVDDLVHFGPTDLAREHLKSMKQLSLFPEENDSLG